MAPVHFVFPSIILVRAHKLRLNEALPVFYHELKQLVKQAMPEASKDTRKQQILHQFVRGLPDNISK